MFFFKKKKLVVDCFMSELNSHVFKYAKIDYSSKFFPDWMRNMSKGDFDFNSMSVKQSIKTCRGIVDSYKHGFIIPMWSDLAIKTQDKNCTFSFSDRSSGCEFTPDYIRGDFYPNHFNIKIVSVWLLRSEKDIYFNFAPAFWNNPVPTPYTITPGTVEFYHQHNTSMQLLVPYGSGNQVIPFGRPMVQVTPFTEREVELRHHLISDNEWTSMNNLHRIVTFRNKYATIKNVNNGKCPFKTGV
jgi:hypothetical protein